MHTAQSPSIAEARDPHHTLADSLGLKILKSKSDWNINEGPIADPVEVLISPRTDKSPPGVP